MLGDSLFPARFTSPSITDSIECMRERFLRVFFSNMIDFSPIQFIRNGALYSTKIGRSIKVSFIMKRKPETFFPSKFISFFFIRSNFSQKKTFSSPLWQNIIGKKAIETNSIVSRRSLVQTIVSSPIQKESISRIWMCVDCHRLHLI